MVQIGYCIVLLLAVDVLLAAQENTTANSLKGLEIEQKNLKNTRRKSKARSTSSSSRELSIRSSGSSKDKDSLDLTSVSDSSDSKDGKKKKKSKKYVPKSSIERKGWRKWHRKCVPCPEEMMKKWRDPSIKWICGAYQRAQRSFKSLCMMHYRNCQDGTMFTKIHEHRCVNDSERVGKPHGDHFFYDYKVTITGESSKSGTTTSSSSSSISDESLFDNNSGF